MGRWLYNISKKKTHCDYSVTSYDWNLPYNVFNITTVNFWCDMSKDWPGLFRARLVCISWIMWETKHAQKVISKQIHLTIEKKWFGFSIYLHITTCDISIAKASITVAIDKWYIAQPQREVVCCYSPKNKNGNNKM